MAEKIPGSPYMKTTTLTSSNPGFTQLDHYQDLLTGKDQLVAPGLYYAKSRLLVILALGYYSLFYFIVTRLIFAVSSNKLQIMSLALG